MVRTSIGEFIAALRKAKGLTQMDVANHLGVSNKTVSSWETGASCPDIALLPAIAEYTASPVTSFCAANVFPFRRMKK